MSKVAPILLSTIGLHEDTHISGTGDARWSSLIFKIYYATEIQRTYILFCSPYRYSSIPIPEDKVKRTRQRLPSTSPFLKNGGYYQCSLRQG